MLSGTPEELQAQANEGEVLELSVYGSKEQLMQALTGVSGILEISGAESEQEDCAAVLIKSGQEIRKEIFSAMVKAGLPIMKLVRHTKTLEDIFLEATAEMQEETLAAEEPEESLEAERPAAEGAEGEEETEHDSDL